MSVSMSLLPRSSRMLSTVGFSGLNREGANTIAIFAATHSQNRFSEPFHEHDKSVSPVMRLSFACSVWLWKKWKSLAMMTLLVGGRRARAAAMHLSLPLSSAISTAAHRGLYSSNVKRGVVRSRRKLFKAPATEQVSFVVYIDVVIVVDEKEN